MVTTMSTTERVSSRVSASVRGDKLKRFAKFVKDRNGNESEEG